MWIQVKGHLQPDVNYRCIPEEEYDTLKASHTNLVEALEAAISILRGDEQWAEKNIVAVEQAIEEAEKIGE